MAHLVRHFAPTMAKVVTEVSYVSITEEPESTAAVKGSIVKETGRKGLGF